MDLSRIDHVALDTVGNAEESAKWIRDHDYGRVILVTNNYHMPRSLLEMRRLTGALVLDPYPVVNAHLDDGGWMTDPDALRVLFTEYNKYLLALARSAVPASPASVGFAMSSQPHQGMSAAAVSSGDHCDVCIVISPGRETSPAIAGHVTRLAVTDQAKRPKPSATNSGSVQRNGSHAKGATVSSAVSG